MRLLALACLLLAPSLSHAESPFWSFWGDGKAELSGYDLVQPRYGALRKGRAVLIFVTEPFSRSRMVKVDRWDRTNPDHVNVLKLNHVRDFQTGLYDYNLMTSVFADPAQGFAPLKVSFSSQEWCGHVFEEARFADGAAQVDINSYFEGETTRTRLSGVGSEDALFISLRGLASQALPADDALVSVLPSAMMRRLKHRKAAPMQARVTWGPAHQVTVPAGAFAVRSATWARSTGGSCTMDLEIAYPHRIIGWQCTDGEVAKLRGSTRLPYWRFHGEGDERHLEALGFKP